MTKALPKGWITKDTVWHVNPTGKFVIGGPDGDAGLTGRKIIVDTYGGAAPHGGGAFSGKDPTKVDRSAAYAARYLAKNVVAAGLAERCTIQLSYAIGVAQPLSIYVDTHGTGKVAEAKLEKVLAKVMDLTPRGIRTHLNLNRRSMRAPRPTATSAARPRRTAASPGRRPTHREALKAGGEVSGKHKTRHSVLRAAQGKNLAPSSFGSLMDECCRAEGRTGRSAGRLVRAAGWKSASAAASIWRIRRHCTRNCGSSARSPSSTASPSSWR